MNGSGAGLTFKVNIVLVRYAQQVVALVRLDGLDEVSFGVLEVDLYSANRLRKGGRNRRWNEEDEL